jgi:hypothetical protein
MVGLRGAAGARHERTAARRQTLVTAGRAARRAQARNGINGRDPRSGRATVYAGFDLEPAERSAYRDAPQRAEGKTLRQPLRGLRRAKFFSAPFLANVSRQKHEGFDDLQFNLLSASAGYPGPAAHKMSSTKQRAGTSGTISRSGDFRAQGPGRTRAVPKTG